MMKAKFCALSLMVVLLASSSQASAGVRATGAQHTQRPGVTQPQGAVAGTWSWIADLIHGWLDHRAN